MAYAALSIGCRHCSVNALLFFFYQWLSNAWNHSYLLTNTPPISTITFHNTEELQPYKDEIKQSPLLKTYGHYLFQGNTIKEKH